MKCKFLSDDFNAVCTNADCDCVADFCPCVNWPQICRHSEDVDEGTTSSVWPAASHLPLNRSLHSLGKA